MRQRVVVTGIGTLGPHGHGGDALARALREGRALLSEVDRSDGYHLAESSTRAALSPKMDLSPWVAPMAARRMSRPSKMAVAAARMALEDARLSPEAAGSARTSIVLATAFGGVSFTERLLREILTSGPESASPFLFAECVANAASAEVGIAVGARGPNITITQREAGPLIALARGFADLRDGRVDRAIVGAVEEMPPVLHAILDRFGALSRPRNGRPESARPFDRNRDGFIAGEGATVLVLESEEAALARNARVLARIGACGSAFDPSASPTDWGGGHAALGRSLAVLLARASIAPRQVDLVVSGASGSRRGDRLEALLLREIWRDGDALPPVLAPKSVTGEYGGGILAASLAALEGSGIGPTPGFERPDPELGLSPHDGRPLRRPSRLLLTSLAAGGAAAWAVIERS